MVASVSGVGGQDYSFSAIFPTKDSPENFNETLSTLMKKATTFPEVLPGVYCPNPNPQTLASLKISLKQG